tara:strand:+ start:258 stop:533 length:276 start_codon:yes stop_codon:yes gene_type:complete
MVAGCRSSGVLTASTLVVTGQVKLVSIHACSVGAPTVIKVFDNTAASGKEIARLSMLPDSIIEFDMHSVLCMTGIYVQEVSGAMEVSIEYS